MTGLLADRDDVEALCGRYRREGRLAIPGFLRPDAAQRLHEALSGWSRWALVTRMGGRHRDFDAAGMERMDPARRAGFDALVRQDAAQGFQYLYERWPLYDPEYDVPLEVPVLESVRRMLAAGAFVDLLRRVTGQARIDFADGQLTRYRRGHFLTEHDDHADGKRRVSAYVLGMTPGWKADFGGQLQFLDRTGAVERAFVPAFNTLYLFSVPQPHLVSAVAPHVDAARLSITGWLRTRGDASTLPGDAAPTA